MFNPKSLKNFGLAMLAVGALIAILFHKSFLPGMTLFANDGPLGVSVSDHGHFTDAWDGAWNDLNWVGISSLAVLPQTSTFVWYLLGDSPVVYSKFQVPLSLLFLGACAWICLRAFGLRHSVCALVAIAAALNMNSFSHAAWGLPSRCWALGSIFLALAAIRSSLVSRPVLKALLAGLAVGNAVMEAYDVGAIYSLYVAAFCVFAVLAWSGITPVNVGRAVLRVGIVAIFSAICAAAGLEILVGTQVKGVAGMQQDQATKEARWDDATMWSLPKAETLRVIIPGLFGYRMDASDGGNYWGAAGQRPGVPQSRHSGSGEYAGVLVILLAAFGVANGFRRKNNPLSDFERRTVIFFGAAALVSLLFAWGRHAPFYRLIYELPFFSTIRNPMKFMHPFHMAVLILFGYGLEVLFRAHVPDVAAKAAGIKDALSAWWKKASSFERRWGQGSVAFAGIFLLGCFIYISSRKELLGHLRTGGFPPELAERIASFSYTEALTAWFFAAVAVALVLVALSGWFGGARARYLVGIFGLFLALDLMRANMPWINYYNYKDLYASNAVIDFLRKDAHEHRATARVTPFGGKHLCIEQQGHPADTSFFTSVANQWLQHHFQYYNIAALEPVQFPRPPEIDETYFKALFPAQGQPPTVIPRLWELTSTKLLVGDKNFVPGLMGEVDGGQQRIRPVLSFDLAPKPGVQSDRATIEDVTWVENPNGRFAVYEFAGALPKASLYPAWTVVTNDAQALKDLASPGFNPRTNLFVHGEPGISPSGGTNFQGTVKTVSYWPTKIELAASNNAPAILLYNDKLDAGWHLTIDGKPAEFVRANYIMRGIPLPAGQHSIVMHYSVSTKGLRISLAGLAVALASLGIVIFVPARSAGVADKSAAKVAEPGK